MVEQPRTIVFEHVTPEDRAWVLDLFKAHKHIWPGAGQMEWWRFSNRADGTPEYWEKIIVDGRALGFVHWRQRRDGWRVIYDLIVDPTARRLGIGRLLVKHVGQPIKLKALIGGGAEPFYDGLGFTRVGTAKSKSGKQSFICYELGTVPKETHEATRSLLDGI